MRISTCKSIIVRSFSQGGENLTSPKFKCSALHATLVRSIWDHGEHSEFDNYLCGSSLPRLSLFYFVLLQPVFMRSERYMPLDRELFHVFLVSIYPQALQLQHPANCFPFFLQGRLHCAIYPCTAKSASRVPHSGKVATCWAPPLMTTTHAQSTSTVDDRVKELNSNVMEVGDTRNNI